MYRPKQFITKLTNYSMKNINSINKSSINMNTIFNKTTMQSTNRLCLVSNKSISSIQPNVSYTTAYINLLDNDIIVDDNDDEGT